MECSILECWNTILLDCSNNIYIYTILMEIYIFLCIMSMSVCTFNFATTDKSHFAPQQTVVPALSILALWYQSRYLR